MTKNYQILEVKISDIKIGDRQRKDMGDIEELAGSIRETDLLQPIGITPDNELVFGLRRLLAYRDVMQVETIPARIVEVQSVLHAQIAEDVMRKEYTVSERVAIVDALRSFGHGGDRRSNQVSKCDDETLTVDIAAKRAGLGGKDGYNRAKRVIDNGVPELEEAMDAVGPSTLLLSHLAPWLCIYCPHLYLNECLYGTRYNGHPQFISKIRQPKGFFFGSRERGLPRCVPPR